MRRLALLLWCVAGCSILNSPADLQRVDAGGADTGVDADAWTDSGDACADVCAAEPEDCDNGVDDDGDGLVDCTDFDCTSDPLCCADGTEVLSEDWTTPLDPRWVALPSTDAVLPLRGADAAGSFLEDFAPAGIPRAIRSNRCVPLALGAEVSVVLQARGASECATEACFASVVFGAAKDMAPGSKLLDDLAVELDQDGIARVTQGGATVAVSSRSYGRAQVRVDIALTLGFGATPTETRESAVLASVRLRSGIAEEALVEQLRVVAQRDLIFGEAGCTEVPGLFFALQGTGRAVWVRAPLEVNTRECANPSQFQRPTEGCTTISSEEVGFGAWAEGGISAPALISTLDVDGGPRWDFLAEATDVDRSREPIGFAVGHAASPDCTAWEGLMDRPRVGDSAPSCMVPLSDGGTPDCGSKRSHREPGVAPVLRSDLALSEFKAVVARELESEVLAGRRERFALYPVARLTDDPRDPAAVVSEPLVTPAEVEGAQCASLRDPALLPRSANAADGFWLFFTCDRLLSGSPVSGIYAIAVNFGLSRKESAMVTVLDPLTDAESTAAYAAGGVWGPEALSRGEGDERVTRLWFMATDASRAIRSVGLLQAQGPTERALPPFVPYPANPVLREGAQAIGPCEGTGCRLLGLSVTRVADARVRALSSTLLFVLARRVNLSLGQRVDLVMLEQFWRQP